MIGMGLWSTIKTKLNHGHRRIVCVCESVCVYVLVYRPYVTTLLRDTLAQTLSERELPK